MAFAAACECGATFNLKDEFAGRTLACPTCNRSFVATAAPPVARVAQADPAFDRDKFLLRQKVMSISEKYEVGDEQNRPILFVLRPAHLMQNLGALLAGLFTALVVIAGFIFLGAQFFKNNGTVFGVMIVLGLVLGSVLALVVAVPLSAKRHVLFFRDPTKTEKLMEVLQDAKFQPINSTFTVRDREGQVLCKLRKNVLYNFFRKRWHCYAPDGSVLCMAMEDSIVLSLLRRFLGPLFGLLRTNFIITPPNSEQVLGEFNRKLTLFDRYVLDMSGDPSRLIDRRIALAIGVMLDTGERR